MRSACASAGRRGLARGLAAGGAAAARLPPATKLQTAMGRPGAAGLASCAQGSAAARTAAQEDAPSTSGRPPIEARALVERFYECYNAGDIDGVMALMADDCQYHDMIYSDPFDGAAEIRAYFDKVVAIVPPDLKFRVDKITSGDPHFVGVKWHVELAGNEFPFSRGASFYEVNAQGKITAARDCVEPALKPGSSALQGLRVMTPIVRKLGPKANPAILKELPLQAYALWAFYAVYVGYVFLSTAAPGEPLYRTPPETWTWVLNDSINFFYVNIAAAAAGLPHIPTPAGNPVSEALFNLVNAWGLLFWPLLVADGKSSRVQHRFRWWLGIMFLTNVFFVPFMALRARPLPLSEQKAAKQAALKDGTQKDGTHALPGYAPALGGVGLAVGCVSAAWLLLGRPEAGGLDARWAFAAAEFGGDRAFWAFVLDLGLYSVWQAVLLGAAGAPARFRFVPFFGLAAWLLKGGPAGGGQQKSS